MDSFTQKQIIQIQISNGSIKITSFQEDNSSKLSKLSMLPLTLFIESNINIKENGNNHL